MEIGEILELEPLVRNFHKVMARAEELEFVVAQRKMAYVQYKSLSRTYHGEAPNTSLSDLGRSWTESTNRHGRAVGEAQRILLDLSNRLKGSNINVEELVKRWK